MSQINDVSQAAAFFQNLFDRFGDRLRRAQQLARVEIALQRDPVADSAPSFGQVDAPVYAKNVRARLGRVVSHPGALEVDVRDGYIHLRGPILSDEVDLVLSELCNVQGIRGISDELEVHEEQDLSSLQGTGKTRRLKAWKRARPRRSRKL